MDTVSQAYAKRLQAEYDDGAPEPPADVVEPDVSRYIHFKAFAFLQGPDEYRKHDALHRPPANLPATRLDAIKRGCEQMILQFRGLSLTGRWKASA